MAIKELLSRLSYSACDCAIDYREEIGVVNGVCNNHDGSVLLVDGVRMEVYQQVLKQKQLDDASRKRV